MSTGTDISASIANALHHTAIDASLALCFPGQGSQKVGMAKDAFESCPGARSVFEAADAILGEDLSGLCFNGPEADLTRTSNAQPALLVASIALLSAALESGTLTRRPAFMAGHSLGEYTALVAAGAISFNDALLLVRERGRLMEDAGKRRPGTMAAVVGLGENEVETLCRDSGAEPCNYNSPTQVVIGGSAEAVERACGLAKERGGRGLPLNVSGAFHTSLMEAAAEEFSRALEHVAVSDPVIPVIGNTTGKPMRTAKGVVSDLRQQILKPVRWHQSVTFMIQQGVSTIVEVGPGRVLTAMLKRAAGEVTTASIDSTQALTSPANV